MSFGEQRMAGEGRCGTCHVCFERMSVLLQDDDGAEGNRVRRSFPDRAHRHLQGARRAFLSGSRALLDRMAGPSKTSTRPAALADPRHQLWRSLGDIKRGHDSRELLSFAGVQRIPSWIVKPRAMPVSAARGEGMRLVVRTAPPCQLEIPERPVVALERGAQYCGRSAGRPSWGGYCWGGYSLTSAMARNRQSARSAAGAPERRPRKNRRLYLARN